MELSFQRRDLLAHFIRVLLRKNRNLIGLLTLLELVVFKDLFGGLKWTRTTDLTLIRRAL